MQTTTFRRFNRSWLWLMVGAALLPFSQFQTVLPLAPWIAPIFLLRFARTQRPAVALPLLALVQYVGVVISLRGIFDTPMVLMFGLAGALGAIPYGVDLLLARRLHGLARTLAFPAVGVALEWGFALSGLGTVGSVAYSQYGVVALNQLAAVTGIWGIVFLMNWGATIVNEAWEYGFDGRSVRRLIVPLAAGLLLVVMLGSLRVAFFSPRDATVRIASLAADRALWHGLRVPAWPELAAASDDVRARARAQFTPITDELFQRTALVARSGAKIVAWSEAATFALKEDEPRLIARAQQVAREEGIYLQMGVVLALRGEAHPYAENRAIMIDPQGNVVWNYAKTIHPLGDVAIFEGGPGIVPTVETPYGTLATIICFDADYPALVRQAGLAGTDILLVPANDWARIDTLHAHAATFRAIENGVALVRPTGNGLSIAVDHLGQELATADYFATDRLTMLSDVQMRGTPTLYRLVGDSFAYACVAVTLGLLVIAFGRLRRVETRIPRTA